MRQKHLDEIRTRLYQTRENLLLELRHKNEEAARLMDEGVADIGDMSLTDELKDFLHLLGDSKREEILRIDDALERLRQGAYGICVQCGEEIDIQRLQIRPTARYCIRCKTIMEKNENEKAGPGRGTI